MDKLTLKTLIDKGLSQRQIAKETGKGQTTVRYWLNKYELLVKKFPQDHKQICIFCKSEIIDNKNKNRSYCNNKCQQTDQRNKKIESGVACQVSLKKHLLETRVAKCEICGTTQWCGRIVPLVMDHIDGNSENNELNNLRLVCGNCDMQLPTYKGKNKGNGRAFRRKRYAEGKSF